MTATKLSGGTMLYSTVYCNQDIHRSIRKNVQGNSDKKRATGRLRATTVLALAFTSLALLGLPGQAFAGDPCSDATEAQYGAATKQCLAAGLGGGAEGGGPAERVAVPSTSDSLPFTGLDVAVLAAVALALTGTGIALRRLAAIGDLRQ